MKWASAVSENPDTFEAVAACSAELLGSLGTHSPDLALVFATGHHRKHFEAIPNMVEVSLEPKYLAGCSGGGVIGGGTEVEHAPGLSMMAATLPGVEIATKHLTAEELESLSHETLPGALGISPLKQPHFVMLPDPFSFPIDRFVQWLDWAYPHGAKVGGLAGGGAIPGSNALFAGGRHYNEGMTLLSLAGNLELDTLVSQGCRPIGKPMFITACHDNILTQLNNTDPRTILQNIYAELDPEDKALFQSSLFLGIEMRPKEEAYERGDFLIRNILGVDPQSGNLVIGARLQETTVVQFHLRDKETAREDLATRLQRHPKTTPVGGALLFSCLGRGMHLYGEADIDSRLFQEHLGPTALAGFFCNGEIGPVEGQTFIHGYTSSFGIFKAKNTSETAQPLAAAVAQG